MDEASTTEKDFIDAANSFRTKMGEKVWTEAQRQNGFKMLTLTYLRLHVADDVMAKMASLFEALSTEYQMRMRLMNMVA